MLPAASVCGWYFSHPQSKYFDVGNKWDDISINKPQTKEGQLENQIS